MAGGPVTVFDEYDPTYPQAFGRLAELVQALVGPTRVEHVGSTAVPGLGGRRVIDAVIVADPALHASIADQLRASGLFQDAAFAWLEPTVTTSIALRGKPYAVLLYVLDKQNVVLRGWLTTRDYLRAHPEEAARYEAIKRQILAGKHTAPWDCQKEKTPYLEELARRLGTVGEEG